MPNQVEVTIDNYKQYVEKLIREKLETVVWGGNASRVQEVLVFNEQYFCGERIKKEIRELICQYLLENKFAFSIVSTRGKKQREWAMPLEPECEPFISIRRDCEESLRQAKEFFDKKARDAVSDFANSKWRTTVFKTDNSLYRQSLRRELLYYPAFIVSTTYAKDWVYPVKYGAPYNKIHEDYERYLEFVNMHIDHFFNFLDRHKTKEWNASLCFVDGMLCHRVEESATRFKYYASMAVVHDVAMILRRKGWDATLFPTHELSSYVELGFKPYDGIPIYLEESNQG